MSIFESQLFTNIVYGSAIVGGAALIGWGGFHLYKFFYGGGAGGGAGGGSDISSVATNPVSSFGVDPISLPVIRPGSAYMDCTPVNQYGFLSDFLRNWKIFSIKEPELSIYEIIISFFGDMIISYGETSSAFLCSFIG